MVAGGGDSGMQEALTLAAHVEKAFIVERGPALTGQAAYVAEIEASPSIQVLTGRELAGVEGADKLTGVRLRNVASGEETTIEAQGLFAFVGLAPNLAPAGHLVALDGEGRIAVDAALRTSARGIFAAGNVRSGNGWRAAAAMGDGASAAWAADRYCADGAWPG